MPLLAWPPGCKSDVTDGAIVPRDRTPEVDDSDSEWSEFMPAYRRRLKRACSAISQVSAADLLAIKAR